MTLTASTKLWQTVGGKIAWCVLLAAAIYTAGGDRFLGAATLRAVRPWE